MSKDFKSQIEDGWDEDDEHDPKQPAAMAAAPQDDMEMGDKGDDGIAAPADQSLPLASRSKRATPSSGAGLPRKNAPLNFPGFIARSALFRAAAPNGQLSQPTTIVAAGSVLIFTGPELGMRDKHVWETALQIAKERAAEPGAAFEIELRDFARRMGSKNCCGPALKSLWACLKRLTLCRLEFEIGDSCKGVGSLIASAIKDNDRLYLRLNPDFAVPALLKDKQFLFNQGRRASLSTALAQWLHDYFSTHAVAMDLDFFYLRNLCGYGGAPRNFPRDLKAAMLELAAKAPGLIDSSEPLKLSRCSDDWKLRTVFGAEKRSYIRPERVADEADGKRGRRRGGVAL